MRTMLFAITLLATPLALAHSTGDEARTPEQCAKFAPPMRGHCLECVGRPRPHHFHPGAPAGARCRPNDGRP